MSPLTILAIAMVVVVGSVLVLRLHAFLALILGSLVVAALTPAASIFENEVRSAGVTVVSVDADADTALAKVGKRQKLIAGRNLIFRKAEQGESFAEVGETSIRNLQKSDKLTRVRFEGEPPRPGDLLLHHTQLAAAKSTVGQSLGERIAVGFGNTCLGIGILIAMAAVIGKCLLESGAAQRIVVAARNAFGESRTPAAFVASGFVVGIPVFFDTVFYLLMPLGKAMYVRTGRNYLLYILTIVAGATMAHSLVPPTPGPLLVANELDVDLGLMILGGCILGLFTVSAGCLYALWANRRWEIPLRESAELSREDLERLAEIDETTLPPLWLSLAPILIPVLFIAGGTVVDMLLKGSADDEPAGWLVALQPSLELLGNKNIALILAAAIAIGTLVWQKRPSRAQLALAVQTALAGGGVIILITAAGGSFGHVLRQTNIAGQIQELMPAAQVGLLIPLAFCVTMLVRIAQGSATVAMITAVGIIAPLAAASDLTYHPVYLALAIGCGSKPIAWMNDSGFWIISRMSGMTELETLKTSSTMSAIMGFVGLAITMLGASLLPLKGL
jgi:GntP family gluconate:H+ symporter